MTDKTKCLLILIFAMAFAAFLILSGCQVDPMSEVFSEAAPETYQMIPTCPPLQVPVLEEYDEEQAAPIKGKYYVSDRL